MWSAAGARRTAGFPVLAGREAPDTSGQVRASETAATKRIARRTGRVYRFISIKQSDRRGESEGPRWCCCKQPTAVFIDPVAISGGSCMRRVSLVFLFSCFAVVVLAGAGVSSAAPVKSTITPAPAFTAEQMNAPAGANWISNMGNLPGDRYSSLTQVTPANVGTLKEAWHIHLGTCPTKDAACGSLEANAVVYEGTYYIQTPKSDVFALDAATGATLWHYVPVYDGPVTCVPTGSCEQSPGFNVGTGGRQPGVAIGAGKIYAARRDG